MEQPDRTDYQYKSLVSWYYIENSSNYPGPKGKVVPDAEGYDDPSKYEGTELYIPIDTKGYKEYAGSTPQFTDYEGNSVPFIKKYFKLNPNMTNPNMTNENLRMQFLSGVITEGEYKAIINKEIKDAEKASLNESMIGGIVGIGAINQIPPRAKADYETAFEYFLGGKYGLNEVEEINENMYYHVLEDGGNGNIGHQGVYDTQEEAQNRADELTDMFPNSEFYVEASDSEDEPYSVTSSDYDPDMDFNEGKEGKEGKEEEDKIETSEEYKKFLDDKMKSLLNKITDDPKLLNVFKRLKDK